MAKLRHWKDNSGELEKYVSKIIESDFIELANAKFIYTFRNKNIYDDDGNAIAAQAHKIPNRERDIYGPDFELSFHKEYWDSLSEKQKYRLVYHELCHCQVETDEDDRPVYDEETNQLVTWLEPHDVIIKTFKKEIDKFGLEPEDVETSRFLAKALKTRIEKQKAKVVNSIVNKSDKKKGK